MTENEKTEVEMSGMSVGDPVWLLTYTGRWETRVAVVVETAVFGGLPTITVADLEKRSLVPVNSETKGYSVAPFVVEEGKKAPGPSDALAVLNSMISDMEARVSVLRARRDRFVMEAARKPHAEN